MLAERPLYVITTSEFQDVQQQLLRSSLRRPGPDKTGPTLRRRAGTAESERDDGDAKPDQDERPTLKRRDAPSQQLPDR
jgi:beta-barrel assembly-enhancing protease